MKAVTHLEKVIAGEVSAVTHLEQVITEETAPVTYLEKVIAGEAPPITHLQKVIAGTASPVTHLEHIWAGGSPTPTEHEYTGAVPVTFNADGTPLLDYLISGNMSQSGTPSPTTPIQPLECGDLETTGEHAGQYKIPILSANTTTPVYLGEVQSTRQIKKLVFDGTETGWQSAEASGGRNRFVLNLIGAINADTTNPYSICSHLPLGASGATYTTDNVYTIASTKLYIRLTANYNALADFKAYLAQQYAAGTPVCVWYVLATEETAVVNEPLRKIGDYADTVSMEQAQVTIPTINGEQTFDVDTTLKPSEVYIKYTGR